MLDFAQLPPEVNSALMYAGPGSGPMLLPRRPGRRWPPSCKPRRPPTTL